MRLTIENLEDTEGHLKKLLSNFRYRLKVREFKDGRKYAGYHDEYGGWHGTFPDKLLPDLLKKSHLVEIGRTTFEGDPYVTYQPTIKGIDWQHRTNRRKANAGNVDVERAAKGIRETHNS